MDCVLFKTYRRNLRSNLAQAGYERDRRVRCAAVGSAGKMVAGRSRSRSARVKKRLRWFARSMAASTTGARAGKGIVYLTPHWLRGSPGRRLNEIGPLTVLYRPPKIAWLGTLLEQRRHRPDGQMATADLKGVRALLAALKAPRIDPRAAGPGAGSG
jgi:KDO2-lipid IV(A) lauroyltransferase